MRGMTLAGKALRDARGATVAVGLGNLLLVFFLLSVYPSYRDSLQGFEIPSYYRGLVGEAGTIATASGYVSAHAFIAVLLLVALAIIGGTGALAGEEGEGTLDLLLAQPVGRARLATVKAAVLALTIASATLAIFAGYLLAALFFDTGLTAGRMFAATVSIIPLAWLFLALSLWGSVTLPSRGAATALAVGVVAAAFFLNTIGAMVDILETPRKASPFYWTDTAHVLLHGFDWARSGAMTAVTATLLLLALRGFARRDVAAGARERRVWSAPGPVRRVLAVRPGRSRSATHTSAMRPRPARFGLARRALRDRRGATAGVGALLFVMMLLDALLYPEYQQQLRDAAVPAPFEAFVGEDGTLGTAAGFVGYILSLFPLLVLVLAVIGGTGALAGDESAGTLDLILAQPVSRARVVLERAAGLGIGLVLANLAILPGFLIAKTAVTIDLGAGRLCAALVMTILLALLTLALALWAGATFARRATAAIVAGSLLVAVFFVNVLGATADVLDGPRRLSPFYWADPAYALLHGLAWPRVALLVAATLLFLAMAVRNFRRREIAAGGRRSGRWFHRAPRSSGTTTQTAPGTPFPRPPAPLSGGRRP